MAKFHLQLYQIYDWLAKWVMINLSYDIIKRAKAPGRNEKNVIPLLVRHFLDICL